MHRILVPSIAALLAAGCGSEPPADPHAGHDHPPGAHDHGPDDHDHRDQTVGDGDHSHDHVDPVHDAVVHGHRDLGVISIGASQWRGLVHDAIIPGQPVHLDLAPLSSEAPEVARAWIGIESGRGSKKTRVEGGDFEYHAHLLVPDPLMDDAALWLELEAADGTTTRGSFTLPAIEYTPPLGHSHEGHDHNHAH